MIRTCPKCGDFYRDATLAFCLVDGTPLVNVEPTSEIWSEGARIIEEKENALNKHKRKLKWRRVVVRSMTMVIAALVVCVVAVNSWIYLRPTTTPTPTPTPTPTHVYKINGRVTDGNKALVDVNITLDGAKSDRTTTDENGNYTFKDLRAGGSYIITPSGVKMDFKPLSLSINNLTQDETANFIGTAQPDPTPTPPKCSVADNSSEHKSILDKYGANWQKKIDSEQPKSISKNVSVRAANANGLAGFPIPEPTKITYESRFPKMCTASVTARFTWRVRKDVNGVTEVLTIPKEKRFTCVKTGSAWRCS